MSTLAARVLRKEMTPPERRLWSVLKTRPEGFKFRRQHPLGPYVLDFFCHQTALAVEVDGLAHELGANPLRDLRRDGYLDEQGIRAIRFRALDVRDDLEAVLTAIVEECVTRAPRDPLHRLRRSPSPANAGEARGSE